MLELREATVATLKARAGALEHIRTGVGGLLECPTLVVGAGGREGAREERGAQQLVQGLADLRLPVPVLGLHRDALEVRGGDQVEEQQLFLVGGEAQGLDPALDLVVKEPGNGSAPSVFARGLRCSGEEAGGGCSSPVRQ